MIQGHYEDNVTEIEPVVRARIKTIYKDFLVIRKDDSREKLLLLVDSITDMRVFTLMLEECLESEIKAALIYFITNTHDVIEKVDEYFDFLNKKGIEAYRLDTLGKESDILSRAVSLVTNTESSVAISNLADDYDVRQAINNYAVDTRIPIMELPTIDMLSFTSEIFSEDFKKMNVLGGRVVEELKKYSHFRFVSSDGTNLTVEVNPNWLDEGNNIFSFRYWDTDPAAVFPQDNPPGEVYTNIRHANGHLVLYQFDNDVAKHILRNKVYLSVRVEEGEYMKYVCDVSDPVDVDVVDDFIDIDTINSKKSNRGYLFGYYLNEKQKEDELYKTEFAKHPRAASRAAELGFGINSKANNPDEPTEAGTYIDSTLITEKKLGIWHIAFGNTPCPDEEQYFHHSSTHIDNGMRNPNLQVFGLTKDGEELLTSTVPNEQGAVDRIMHL